MFAQTQQALLPGDALQAETTFIIKPGTYCDLEPQLTILTGAVNPAKLYATLALKAQGQASSSQADANAETAARKGKMSGRGIPAIAMLGTAICSVSLSQGQRGKRDEQKTPHPKNSSLSASAFTTHFQ